MNVHIVRILALLETPCKYAASEETSKYKGNYTRAGNDAQLLHQITKPREA